MYMKYKGRCYLRVPCASEGSLDPGGARKDRNSDLSDEIKDDPGEDDKAVDRTSTFDPVWPKPAIVDVGSVRDIPHISPLPEPTKQWSEVTVDMTQPLLVVHPLEVPDVSTGDTVINITGNSDLTNTALDSVHIPVSGGLIPTTDFTTYVDSVTRSLQDMLSNINAYAAGGGGVLVNKRGTQDLYEGVSEGRLVSDTYRRTAKAATKLDAVGTAVDITAGIIDAYNKGLITDVATLAEQVGNVISSYPESIWNGLVSLGGAIIADDPSAAVQAATAVTPVPSVAHFADSVASAITGEDVHIASTIVDTAVDQFVHPSSAVTMQGLIPQPTAVSDSAAKGIAAVGDWIGGLFQ